MPAKRGGDDELAVIGKILALLRPLSPAARGRVVAYVRERADEAPPSGPIPPERGLPMFPEPKRADDWRTLPAELRAG